MATSVIFNLSMFVTLGALYPIITKYCVTNIHPDYASVISSTTWIAGLMCIAGFQLKTVPLELNFKIVVPLLILGTFGALMTFFNYRATSALPVSYVVMARSVTPAISIGVAYFLFGDSINLKQFLCLVLVLAGGFGLAYFKE